MSQTNTNTNTGAVTPTVTMGRGGSGGRGRGSRGKNRGKTIAKYSFEGKMKDGPHSKLTITDGGQRATQYKKIIDTLPVFCADKGYKFIDDIIQTSTERLQASFLLTYLDAGQ